jgi:hypothetical protein
MGFRVFGAPEGFCHLNWTPGPRRLCVCLGIQKVGYLRACESALVKECPTFADIEDGDHGTTDVPIIHCIQGRNDE